MPDVTMHIDGVAVTVPKGTKVIRAAESLGIEIPRFCDHPLLDPVAACRQCMVDVPDAGNGRGMKPQPACALDAMEGMVVKTGATSDIARAAQEGMLEFLLINHPLDCPMCDKAGECPLQNQAYADGRGESRYDGIKRTYPKPTALTDELLLDRERCVLCQRCTRFGDQISGDLLLSLVERGATSQIGRGPDAHGVSYFSGNLAQICPVGAITTKDYRFQGRPFDIVSTTTTCDNCAAGCSLRVDQRHGEVRRRLAATSAVNEEWNCDRGRFGFRSAADRLTTPLVRTDGELRPASWPQALAAAADGLKSLDGKVGVLPGGRLTMENALAYARFARLVLGTAKIDARTRRGASVEEAQFLGRYGRGAGVAYTDLESARQVVLVGLEPEDECPMVFLRLRKAVRKSGTAVVTVAPGLSAGSRKLKAKLVPTAPGDEAAALADLLSNEAAVPADTVVLVGERASQTAGVLSAIESIAADRGVRLAWVPRRAGELGAALVGCVPGWGGSDSAAQAALSSAWDTESLSAGADSAVSDILAGAAQGELGLVLGGVDLDDLDDPAAARQALAAAPFVLSLEQRPSAATELADVVLPVSLLAEQAGTFMDWTKTERPVAPVVPPQPMTDRRVLAELARRMGGDIGLPTFAAAQRMVRQVASAWAGLPAAAPASPGALTERSTRPALVLATWRSLLVGSRCLDGAGLLPRPATAVAAPAAYPAAPASYPAGGDEVVVQGPTGCSAPVPLVLDDGAVPGVIWLPDADWPSGTPVTLQSAAPDDAATLQSPQGGER